MGSRTPEQKAMRKLHDALNKEMCNAHRKKYNDRKKAERAAIKLEKKEKVKEDKVLAKTTHAACSKTLSRSRIDSMVRAVEHKVETIQYLHETEYEEGLDMLWETATRRTK